MPGDVPLARSLGCGFYRGFCGWLALVAGVFGCGVDYFPRLAAAAVAVLSLFCAAGSFAQTVCGEFQFTVNGIGQGWFKSWGAAASSLDAYCMSVAGTDSEAGCFYNGISQVGHTLTSHTTTRSAVSGTNYTGSVNWCERVDSTGVVTCRTTAIGAPGYRADPAGCPSCQPAGARYSAVVGAALSGVADGASACMNDGCSWTATNEYRTLVAPSMRLRMMVSTGNSCSALPDSKPVATMPVAAGDTCVSNASGDVVCDSAATGCGSYNGEAVCITAAAPGECRTTSNGGSICVSNSSHAPSTPPAPDTGVAGNIAGASMSITVGDTTANYYSSTVVSGSSAGGSVSSGSTDGVTRGGSGTGSGSAGTPEEIDAAVESEGVTASGKVPEHSVDVSSISPQSGALVGSCPSPISIEVWGRSMTLDVFGAACGALESVRPVVLLVAWLSAAMILGSAFSVKV